MIAIKTEKVQDMMNKAIKICSFENESPLTGLVEVKVEAGYLYITTTDTVINFRIAEKVDSEENMRVVVDAKLLTSLVNKITTPEIFLPPPTGFLLPFFRRFTLMKRPSMTYSKGLSFKIICKADSTVASFTRPFTWYPSTSS